MSRIIDYLLSMRFVTSCIAAVVCVAICIILGKTKKTVNKKVESLKDPKAVITRRLTLVGQVLVILIGFTVICQINGINIISLVAGFGIAGAVAGLALQDYLKDVIMGIHILSDRFFAIGDCVEINGKEGVVVSFSLTTTKIELITDRSTVSFCNRDINEVRKLSGLMFIDLPLPYGEDSERIHSMLTAACPEITKLKEVKKCEFVGTDKFESSSILYRFAVYHNSAKKHAVRRAVLFELQKLLKREGIAIPFEQLDVHIDSGADE